MFKNNYAFIDSQNLNLGTRSRGWVLDFARFRIYLGDKYGVGKAFLFMGYVADMEWLYAELRQAGYIIIFKPVLLQKVGSSIVIKGNVDAELVLHSMIEYGQYTQAVIVSGDGDFHCLIEYLDDKEKLLKIIVPNERFSSLLRKFNRYILDIGLLRNKLSRQNKREAFPRDETRR